jgi:hypothetical protein
MRCMEFGPLQLVALVVPAVLCPRTGRSLRRQLMWDGLHEQLERASSSKEVLAD